MFAKCSAGDGRIIGDKPLNELKPGRTDLYAALANGPFHEQEHGRDSWAT